MAQSAFAHAGLTPRRSVWNPYKGHGVPANRAPAMVLTPDTRGQGTLVLATIREILQNCRRLPILGRLHHIVNAVDVRALKGVDTRRNNVRTRNRCWLTEFTQFALAQLHIFRRERLVTRRP